MPISKTEQVTRNHDIFNGLLADRFDEIDSDKDKKITQEEFLKAAENMVRRGGRGGFRGGPGGGPPGGGGPGGPGFGRTRTPPTPGKKISVADVDPIEGHLCDPAILRTVFIQFDNDDWESELEEFHNTDVDVPATLTVDGKEYPLCGVCFRGASSYMMIPTGYKRSFNISLDMVHDKQRLYGYKTLNLLNGNGDESFMSTVLYSTLAAKHIPVPKANFVRVVVNGENWGIYTNVQQFNKEFLKENYGSSGGARWKVQGSPRGGGGLDYRGPDAERYESPYEMKDGGKKDLKKFIELCRILDEVPTSELKRALEGKVDIDGLLWFLAYDVALCNSDGYWIRASDYSIYLDKEDQFHFIPNDMNEAFRLGGEFGRRESGGAGPDPLVGMDDPQKPLRSKILAVPEFRDQYLRNIETIAQELKWENLSPVVAEFRKLIDEEVKSDTRKLGSYEGFQRATADSPSALPSPERREGGFGRGPGGGSSSLRDFADRRSKFLQESVLKLLK